MTGPQLPPFLGPRPSVLARHRSVQQPVPRHSGAERDALQHASHVFCLGTGFLLGILCHGLLLIAARHLPGRG